MKIGILTQPLWNNYGGLLQNFALQQALIKLGHDPITIDQRDRDVSALRNILACIKVNLQHFLMPSKFKKPKYVPTVEEQNYIRQNSIQFIDTYIRHTVKFPGGEAFKKACISHGIEALVVGSDQCWRPLYNVHLRDMFLEFAKELPIKKRVAYAASFGTDQWEFNPEQTAVCSELAKEFDTVTVREKSGVDLCKKYLGVNATHVLDPTMLLTKEEYIDVIEKAGVRHSEGNLFTYILDPTDEKTSFIDKVSKSLGYTPFQVLPICNEDHRSKDDVKNRIDDCVYPSALVWLRAFMDAEMTIVDSFHGMVFSIIFNKPFWVIGNEERGMSRFSSLLSMFELEDRLITVEKLDTLDYELPINWVKVNEKLAGKRIDSVELIRQSFE